MSIRINNIEFGYDDFNLSANLIINAGEFHSILGPSGSGKTTLLRLIAGFQTPEFGRILLGNKEITRMPTSRRNIGMVFQDYALFPHMNVFHNISYGLHSLKHDRGRIKSRVSELLKLVSLSGYEGRRIDELSGGEKQRVALARAIAPEPELLLFDEPLSALDVKLRKKLRREIKFIQQELGFTAVYVTHDQEEAMSISDRISVMNEGRICQTGTPEELYNSPADYFTADFIGVMNRIGDKMFRPEACSVIKQPESSNPDNSVFFPVIIETSEYTGGRYTCEGKTEKNELITFYNGVSLNPGEEIRLIVEQREIIIP